MMDLSQTGLIGAGLGLALGVFEWSVILPMIERHMRAAAETSTTDPEPALRMIRLAFATAAVAFPTVGYVAGKAIEGGL